MYSLRWFGTLFHAAQNGGALPTDDGAPLRRRESIASSTDGRWVNRLTIGHVVLGFLGFRQKLLSAENPQPRWRFLSPAEMTVLERWQEQYDAGRFSPELFASSVESLIRDRAPNKVFAGFAMFGSAIPRIPRYALTTRLNLSVDQEEGGVLIFNRLHERIGVLQQRAQENILGHLNCDVQTLFDRLRDSASSSTSRTPVRLFERILAKLGISGELQANLVVTLAMLRNHVQAEHQDARNRFIESLTYRQRELLKNLEHGNPTDRGPRAEDRTWTVR